MKLRSFFGAALLLALVGAATARAQGAGNGETTLVAPIISGTLAEQGQVGTPFTYSINTNILPDTFQATGLPPGLTLEATTGIITGTPTEEGTYNVLLSATDTAGGTGTATLVLTFGYPPIITSSLTLTSLLNQSFTYQIQVIHQVTQFTAYDLPDGLTLNTSTGFISGTPTQGGTYQSTITAYNVFGSDQKMLILRFISDTAVSTVHAFDGTDGYAPSGLILAADGNFYGTTKGDGTLTYGTVFKVTPKGVVTTLHQFNNGDGTAYTGVIQANNGAFYGTTGTNSQPGILFKVTSDGTFTTLKTFGGGFVRSSPTSLILASDGCLYGAAGGNAFRVTSDDTVTTLPDANASFPFVQGSDESLYGIMSYPAGGGGSIFRLALDGTVTTLHTFTGGEGSPYSGLIQASDGTFYGTTGGPLGINPAGSIYKFALDGTLTTLHSLHNEGNSPSSLIQGKNGNFYGVTSYGSTDENLNGGTVFEMTPNGDFTTLHNFTGSDGSMPSAPLILGADGNFYGTTSGGGNGNAGTFFRTRFGDAPVDLNVPVATLTATEPLVNVGSGGIGQFTVTLTAAQASNVVINYRIQGSAANGTDYVTLSGTKKIKAGKTSQSIKVIPLSDLGGASKKTVTLTLEAGTGYTVGNTDKVKVKILAGQ